MHNFESRTRLIGIKEAGYQRFHDLFASLEKWVLTKVVKTQPFTVWIIGPPRSGTTLLYQLLIQQFDFVYFTNLSARFYRAPVIVTFFTWPFVRRESSKISFKSFHGVTPGWTGPHEAGPFWYRWFPQGEHVYVSPGHTPLKALSEMRRTIAGMSKTAKAPALFKNTYNSMRIAPILETFPDACFLICRRDPLDIAQSILNGRMRAKNSKHEWWSLPPKEIDQLKSVPYWEQVVKQVYYVYKQIDEDRHRFGGEQFYNVSYKDLCMQPAQVINGIENFLSHQGINPNRKKVSLPAAFPYSSGQQVSDEDYQLLKMEVEKLWGEGEG